MFTCQQFYRCAAALMLIAVTAAAQTNATDWNSVKTLPVGTGVRIIAGTRSVNGKIDRITDDLLAVNSGKDLQTFTRAEVTHVSARGGNHRRRHIFIGLGIGAAGGGALGGAAASTCGGSICGGHGSAVVGATIGAGALVGGLIGAALPTGGWHEIYRK